MTKENSIKSNEHVKKSHALQVALTRAAVVVLIGITWIYIILRSRPMPGNDYQAFLFLGSRLAQGDKLYVDIWDNKDPLTYWIAALVSQSYPVSSHFVELIWFITIAISTYFIARAFLLSPLIAALSGGILGPLAILNLAYFQGATESPGIALMMAALALTINKRYLFGGIVLGVLVFLKIVFIPVAFSLVLYWLITKREFRAIQIVILGFLGTLLSFLILLRLRGELFGYFETLRMNTQYSNAQLADGAPMQLGDALLSRLSLLSGHQLSGTLLVVSILFIITGYLIYRMEVSDSKVLKRAWMLTAIAFLTSFFVLFITAKLPHHLLLLTFPIILGSLLTISIVQNIQISRFNLSQSWRQGVAAVTTLALAVLATGVLSPLDHKFLAESGWNRINTELSTGTATQWLLDNRQLKDTPIAFLGHGISNPITGTDIPWKLACRFTGQGPTTAQWILNETLSCIGNSEIVIVGRDANPLDQDGNYNTFLAEAEAELAANFDCVDFLDITVCQKL